MTTPTGTISLRDVNIELGRPAGQQIDMSESAVRSLAGKLSGTISLNDLRGKSAVDQVADFITGLPDNGVISGINTPIQISFECIPDIGEGQFREYYLSVITNEGGQTIYASDFQPPMNGPTGYTVWVENGENISFSAFIVASPTYYASQLMRVLVRNMSNGNAIIGDFEIFADDDKRQVGGEV
jgi:hypothetical protein